MVKAWLVGALTAMQVQLLIRRGMTPDQAHHVAQQMNDTPIVRTVWGLLRGRR